MSFSNTKQVFFVLKPYQTISTACHNIALKIEHEKSKLAVTTQVVTYLMFEITYIANIIISWCNTENIHSDCRNNSFINI